MMDLLIALNFSIIIRLLLVLLNLVTFFLEKTHLYREKF